MKKNILLLLTLIFCTRAHAEKLATQDASCCHNNFCFDMRNFYAKILAGNNFLNDNKASYRSGYIISGSLGYCWRYGLSVEGEYAYRRNGISKLHFFGFDSSNDGHFQTSSFMANLLWNLPLSSLGCICWNIQPFIGAGIGYDVQKMHASNCLVIFDQKARHFSWQFLAGFAYPIFCNTEMTLEYRFHQAGCHFNNHSVGVGLIYSLGACNRLFNCLCR